MSKAADVLKPRMHAERMDVGLSATDRKELAGGLSEILVDTYRLLIKTHIYHWNVVGPLFHAVHVLTEEQYNALFNATDVIAERVRALGHHAPAGRGVDTAIELDAPGRSAMEMVEDLIVDHEEAVKKMRTVATAADEKGDLVTTDMLTERMTFHEKALWMLRATVAE
ncbi:DNA starvation/stationary phase protection protein [Chelativorans sp. M5D2P16]|uniref:Dps family protein n=1 Tax=Chelativorans sp. M5D2P16 TaxID=3095678 RepID=UPI002ACA5835|nr:DNA starvation/stationary phase protection protein [Chelativorans sp. M5D2P16]MDZ5699137.1 DNA starvation/stationary phase protection protein [Chelativorans sp. M5D2P16]